jgi:hypothetical protein
VRVRHQEQQRRHRKLELADDRHLLLSLRIDHVGNGKTDLQVHDLAGKLHAHEDEKRHESHNQPEDHLADDGRSKRIQRSERRYNRNGMVDDERDQQCETDPRKFRDLRRRKHWKDREHRRGPHHHQQERFELRGGQAEDVDHSAVTW